MSNELCNLLIEQRKLKKQIKELQASLKSCNRKLAEIKEKK